jgi:hypothetical protein
VHAPGLANGSQFPAGGDVHRGRGTPGVPLRVVDGVRVIFPWTL